MADVRGPYQKALEEALKPISKLVDKVAGPLAKEFGLTVGEGMGIVHDNVREYRQKREIFRYARQVELWKKVNRMIEEAHFQPQPVAPRFLLPAVEAASEEGDEELQELWAALIANAADPRRSMPLHIYFPQLLGQLTKDQAQFVSAVYETQDSEKQQNRFIPFFSYNDLLVQYVRAGLSRSDLKTLRMRIFHKAEWETNFASKSVAEREQVDADVRNFEIAIENLLRLSLMSERTFSLEDRFRTIGSMSLKKTSDKILYILTETGREFVQACTRPTPTNNDRKARSRKRTASQ